MEVLVHIVSLVVSIIMAQKGLFLLLLLGISSIGITESTNISAAGNDFDLNMVDKNKEPDLRIINVNLVENPEKPMSKLIP